MRPILSAPPCSVVEELVKFQTMHSEIRMGPGVNCTTIHIVIDIHIGYIAIGNGNGIDYCNLYCTAMLVIASQCNAVQSNEMDRMHLELI